ncbi:MAG: hypothetical protein JRF40_13690 [Deltaproteobacteria bacterium]|nr:hypothetical protein [Deltaproteobacteria bacterium]
MEQTDFLLLKCKACGTKNRIPAERASGEAKCGKCGKALEKHAGKTDSSDAFKMRCADCGTQNRIPANKLNAEPKCGKCGAMMPTGELFLPQPVMVTDTNFDKSKIRVGKINVDANPVLSSKFNILSVPYLFIFDGGQMRENFPGGIQKHELMLKMAHYL